MVVQGEGGAVIRGKKVTSFDITNKTLFMISEFHVMIIFCRDLVESLSRRPIKPLSLASTMSPWLEVNATWLWRGSAITLSSLISKFTHNKCFKPIWIQGSSLLKKHSSAALYYDFDCCCASNKPKLYSWNDLRNNHICVLFRVSTSSYDGFLLCLYFLMYLWFSVWIMK